MIRPKLLFCAEGVVVDQMTNNASAFNILEQLNFLSLPVVFPRMFILNLLERSKEDPKNWKGRLRIDLAGSVILDQPLEHKFEDQLRSRHITTLGGLPITQPGIMEISLVDENDEKIISYTIEIVVPPGPKVETSESCRESKVTPERSYSQPIREAWEEYV